jgi:hypothetical protein
MKENISQLRTMLRFSNDQNKFLTIFYLDECVLFVQMRLYVTWNIYNTVVVSGDKPFCRIFVSVNSV